MECREWTRNIGICAELVVTCQKLRKRCRGNRVIVLLCEKCQNPGTEIWTTHHHILGCFKNDLINDWIFVNRDHFTTPFKAFMIKFRAHWLLHDWEQNIRSKILSTWLYPQKQRFKDWAAFIQSTNISLRGTASHLDGDRIHLQLEASLDDDLQSAAHNAKAHNEKLLHPWIACIKELPRESESLRP